MVIDCLRLPHLLRLSGNFLKNNFSGFTGIHKKKESGFSAAFLFLLKKLRLVAYLSNVSTLCGSALACASMAVPD